ncbi:MAG: N-6 DNA methylase [Bacteroidales bacterium]|nr:N-6 DNA methylase [Bacteroidales bacterium]MDY6347312.1 N-6 DNA methylase [Bacteroidales bacterium]
MKDCLKRFVNSGLFEASLSLLDELGIRYTKGSAQTIDARRLSTDKLSKAADAALDLVSCTWFVAQIDDRTFQQQPDSVTLDLALSDAGQEKYNGLFVFAVEVKPDANVTRTVAATLTRVFNRIAKAQPVILFIRQGHELSLSTCERSEYTQQWRSGEKLGKVSILRNINCENAHRGHIDILNSIRDKAYSTFDELYKHWMEVFSSELLTKKFYGELSDWYAWAVKVVHFPNDLSSEADNQQYNSEAMIRLITRLIFVWFLKQRHLIPEEFFNEKFIAENLIKGFSPNARVTLFGKSEESHYYKGILQNLFFAMLNSPITPEGKDTISERRFRNGRGDYDNNKLMRYEDLFINPDLFVKLANEKVPFLNGGLFDCLDDKDNGIYIDAFTDRENISCQLVVPDYLFFGEDVGRNIDLSEWYGDAKKKKVSAKGIIDILSHYNFTIEENTPLEQEVSLDPELLGKVFENLLASYNPETQTTARKQTGSFYTPREIVQYMVDESLVAHLKRSVGDEMEPKLRQLVQYNDIEPELTANQKKTIMQSLYNCKVLDPACGSGAFPMGMLQQMVHVLNRIDPNNALWKEIMVENAISETSEAYRNATDEERAEMVADIERSFNESINRPDYARKLYLIENCIYGVDIQPIAIQISKLRFFISLVVDQKTNNNPVDNFGIRPLPNLEAKFVAANTLIGLEKKEANLFDSEAIKQKEKELKEAKHRIFGAKTVKTKRKYKERVATLCTEIADTLKESGSIGNQEAQQLSSWDMFDQHTSSPFFDPEWMFGVGDGFDVVIGNPPYISAPAQIADYNLSRQRQKIIDSKKYKSLYQKWDLYIPFIELGTQMNKTNGITSMIVPFPLTNQLYAKVLRKMLVEENDMFELVDLNGTKIFENATVSNCIPFIKKTKTQNKTWISKIDRDLKISRSFEQTKRDLVQDEKTYVWNVTQEKRESNKHTDMHVLGDYCYISEGMKLNADEKIARGEFKKEDLISLVKDEKHPREYYEGKDIEKYFFKNKPRYLEYDTDRVPAKLRRPTFSELYSNPKLMFNILGDMRCVYDINKILHSTSIISAVLWKELHDVENKSIASSIKKFSMMSREEMEELSESLDLRYLLGVMNSKYASVLLTNNRGDDYHIYAEHIRNIPIPSATKEQQQPIIALVDKILAAKKSDPQADTSAWEAEIDFLIYKLYGLSYDEVLVVDPETGITREEYERG